MEPAYQAAAMLEKSQSQKASIPQPNLFYSLANREQHGYFTKNQQVFCYKKSIAAALAENNYTQAILDCEAIYRLTAPYLLSLDERVVTNHYQLMLESSSKKVDWIEYRRLGNDLLRFVITHYSMTGLVTLTLAGSEWALANLSFYSLHAKKNIPLNVVTTERLSQLKQENLPLYYYFSIIIPLAQRSDRLSPAHNQQLMEQSSAALREFQTQQVNHPDSNSLVWLSILQIHYFLMLGISAQDPTTTMLTIMIALEHQVVFAVPVLLNFCQVYLPTHKANNLSCLFWLNSHLLGANKIPLPNFINKQFAEICIKEHDLRPNASNLSNNNFQAYLHLPTTKSSSCVLELDICIIPSRPVYDFRPASLDNLLTHLIDDEQMESFNNVSDEWKNNVRALHIPELARIILGDHAYQTDISILLLKWSAHTARTHLTI